MASQVAVLHCQQATVFNAAVGAQDFTVAAMQNMHETLWKLGYAVEYVDPDHLTDLAAYRVLVLPFITMLSQASAAAIAQYVEAGGAVVTMPRTAMVDENCHVWPSRPGGLHEVTGATETGLCVEDAIALQAAIGDKSFTLTGAHHRQQLALAEDVEVLGSFANGDPAITLRRHGTGRAVHCATHLDLVDQRDRNYLAFWSSLLASLGAQPQVEVEAEGNQLDVSLLRCPDNKLVLVVANEASEPADVAISLPKQQFDEVRNLWPVGHIALAAKGRLQLQLPAREALVACLSKATA